MAYMKPTSEQVALAKFLIEEDDDDNSPLVGKLFTENKPIWNELLDVSYGREYIGEYRNEINQVIKKLDEEFDGYITKNWNNED